MSRDPQERALWLARHVLPHEAALRSWLHHKTTAGLDVDDIVQETYAILAGRESVSDIHNPKSYMFQTAYSVVLTYVRRSRIVSFRAIADVELLSIPATEPSPERQAVVRDELYCIAEAIASLPPRVREAFILRRVEGLSQREVATRMEVSENTVEKHITKAIRHLMTLFGRGGKTTSRASKDGMEEESPVQQPPEIHVKTRDEPRD